MNIVVYQDKDRELHKYSNKLFPIILNINFRNTKQKNMPTKYNSSA